MRQMTILLFIFSLIACSAPVNKVNYYMLYVPTNVSDPSSQANKSIKVRLNKIVLADYLKQSGLSMQINQNQMYFSRHDLWAESLEAAIAKVLLIDLNKSEHMQIIGYNSPLLEQNMMELNVQIDHFYPTDRSTVLVSGAFWITSAKAEKELEQPFFFQLPLSKDGFTHAVEQQRALLQLVAQQIQQELSTLDI
ncbi:MAG: ABC-type transport auxiliary lipoprotein family protein [Paraglaciecola sp.]|nr:ABC-type transport auxiliary lipoprotein family protein [Paraglaciecola sp.]